MKYRFVLGLPLVVALVVFTSYGWHTFSPSQWVQPMIERWSPQPSVMPSPSSAVMNPCELVKPEELTRQTAASYLPARLSVNQRQDGLLIQKCVWLAVDEKLTPMVTATIVSAETASDSAVAEYWREYLEKNQSNARFRKQELAGYLEAVSDSWGSHVLLKKAVVSLQVSMPSPSDNQRVEKELLQISQPLLWQFYSLDQSGDESQGQ